MEGLAKTSRRKRILSLRLFLLAVFVIELLVLCSLRSQGWVATGDSINLVLAISLAAFPLMAALIVLLFRGRRFSLRSMMIATTLLAVFVSMIAYPITQIRARRRISVALEVRGIQYETNSNLARVYQRMRIPYHQEPVALTRNTDDIAVWMKPLVGASLPTYPDRAVRVVPLFSDEEVQEVADLLGELPNLEEVRLNGPGVTSEGLRQVARLFPQLESLHLDRINIPDDWGCSLRGVRRLSIAGDFRRRKPTVLSDQQLTDLIKIPSLEILFLNWIDINNKNVALLTESRKLKFLSLWHTNLTAAGHDAMRDQNPELILHVGPDVVSPGRFLDAIESLSPDQISIRVAYNEAQSEWGRKWSEQRGEWQYFGDGWARIRDDFPITIELRFRRPLNQQLVASALHRLCRFVDHTGWEQSSLEQTDDTVTIKLEYKAPSP